MNPEQQAAYVFAQAVCAMGEIAGMQAHDRHQEAVGSSQFYTEEAYRAVANKYGIHHNAVLGLYEG